MTEHKKSQYKGVSISIRGDLLNRLYVEAQNNNMTIKEVMDDILNKIIKGYYPIEDLRDVSDEYRSVTCDESLKSEALAKIQESGLNLPFNDVLERILKERDEEGVYVTASNGQTYDLNKVRLYKNDITLAKALKLDLLDDDESHKVYGLYVHKLDCYICPLSELR